MKKVYDILRELSGIDKITLESDLQNDLVLDSLAMVILLIELEDAFDIQIDESDMNPLDLKDTQAVINLVKKYCGDEDE